MDMLQTVMRPSIDRARMAEPRYSMTEPIPPPVPMRPMIARTMSLAVTPAGRSPSTVTAMVPGRRWGRVWVARTCSTSLVPMPKASAPKAPWVEVWESPQTMVMPGWVRPCSGPMMWTMPWLGVAHRVQADAELGGVGPQRLDLGQRDRVLDRPEGGGDVVVLGGDGQVRPAHGPAGQAQAVEGLG